VKAKERRGEEKEKSLIKPASFRIFEN